MISFRAVTPAVVVLGGAVVSIGLFGPGTDGAHAEASVSVSAIDRAEAVLHTLAGPIDAGSGGLVVDRTGRVYTADFGASLGGGAPGTRIHRVDPNTGEVSVFAEGFRGASGNTIGPDGSLYQSNIAGNLISKVSPDGVVETYATGLVNPVGIVMDGDDLIVANCGNGTLARVTPDATVETFVRSDLLQCPNGIARSDAGDFYVANFMNGDVIRITPNGEASRFATVPGNNNGHITFGNGMLYVVARAANQLYALSLDGELTLIAGNGERGRDDGPALNGTLSLPNDLGLSPDGTRLYFNDVDAGAGSPVNLAPVWIRYLELDGP